MHDDKEENKSEDLESTKMKPFVDGGSLWRVGGVTVETKISGKAQKARRSKTMVERTSGKLAT